MNKIHALSIKGMAGNYYGVIFEPPEEYPGQRAVDSVRRELRYAWDSWRRDDILLQDKIKRIEQFWREEDSLGYDLRDKFKKVLDENERRIYSAFGSSDYDKLLYAIRFFELYDDEMDTAARVWLNQETQNPEYRRYYDDDRRTTARKFWMHFINIYRDEVVRQAFYNWLSDESKSIFDKLMVIPEFMYYNDYVVLNPPIVMNSTKLFNRQSYNPPSVANTKKVTNSSNTTSNQPKNNNSKQPVSGVNGSSGGGKGKKKSKTTRRRKSTTRRR